MQVEWILYHPRGTLEVFLVILQPFLKLETIGEKVSKNLLFL